MILPDYRHKLNNAETLRGINPHKLKSDFSADLRKQYYWVMHYAVIVSLMTINIILRFFPMSEPEQPQLLASQEIIDIEQIDITRQEERPPPPQRPPVVIEAPVDGLLDDLDISWGDLSIFDDAPPARPFSEMEEDFEHYFVAVEEMPELIGGVASIMRHVHYPELARRAGVEGTVYVLAYVDEEGVVQKVDIARGIGAGLDEAAMEAVMKARFTPGKQRGVPRKVVVTVPVRFSIRTQE
jgi:periplasmic protein TonB